MTATAGDPARLAQPLGRPLTIEDELERLAPGWSWDDVLTWPPDTFGLTSVLLADSGAYRFVVCPPPGEEWPPTRADGNGSWENEIQHAAAIWAAAPASLDPLPVVRRFAEPILAARELALASLDDPAHWKLVVAILGLHALADEACDGVGLQSETPLQLLACRRLSTAGTLARFSPDRLRVLPKLRPPESGITLRSLSHHLAIDRSEVETRWYYGPSPRTQRSAVPGPLSLLLVPLPQEVHASDFHPISGPLQMDESHYGFFEYAPQECLDFDELLRLVNVAQRHVGKVDAVVLPEAALDESAVGPLQQLLEKVGVGYLIAGVRQPPGAALTPFGGNYAHLGGRDWRAPPQHKHHRWLLDATQVHQYHLGATLDPSHDWWEATSVQRRSLTFATVSGWLTICPLVCEDLARPDPVTDVIRAVAPTLVVALLLDGPQLAERWSARYASVLAEDPGCSVLTLTALGMARRCQPPGYDPSQVIALWKDPHRGLQEIQLADGARAVAITTHARQTRPVSADGRRGKNVPQLVLSGLEQIR